MFKKSCTLNNKVIKSGNNLFSCLGACMFQAPLDEGGVGKSRVNVSLTELFLITFTQYFHIQKCN